MSPRFFTRLSLRYKLLLSSFVPAVLFIGIFSLYAYSFNSNIKDSFAEINQAFSQLTLISNLDTAVSSLAETTKAFVLSRDPALEKKYDDLSILFDDLLSQAIKMENTPEGKQIIEQFAILTEKLKGTELLIISKSKAGDIEKALNLYDFVYSGQEYEAGQLLNTFVDKEREEVLARIASSLRGLTRSEGIFIIISIAFLLIIAFLVFYIFQIMLLKPVEQLAVATKKISEGDYSTRADVKYEDEIGSLALSFNTMTEKLQISYQNLNAKVEELVLANIELKNLDKMKSDFVSIAAHQLRTPLSGIKWTLQMLTSGELGPLLPDQKSFLEKTYDSNERMIKLVNDLLNVNRIESGKFQYAFVKTYLHEVLDSVLFDIRHEASNKGISITGYDVVKEMPPVLADPAKIREVFQNLLDNSIKYSKAGDCIRIDFKREGDFVITSISDSGIGIPKMEQENIFTRFFRATNALKVITDGSGLGLYVVKNLVEKHGGKVWFESLEGTGTKFYFTLPVFNNNENTIQ